MDVLHALDVELEAEQVIARVEAQHASASLAEFWSAVEAAVASAPPPVRDRIVECARALRG